MDPPSFPLILDQLPGVVYVFDLERRAILYTNQRWRGEPTFSPENDEAAQRPQGFSEIIHPDDLPRILEHHTRLAECPDDRVFTIEARMRAPDGSWLWVEAQERVLSRDASGRATRSVGISRDIAARRSAELALRESEGRFRAILEYHPDAVLIADEHGHLIEANATACTRLGYTREELLSRRIVDILPPEEHETLAARHSLRLSGRLVETEHVRKDGSRFPVEVAVMWFETGGRPVAMGVARDISNRKSAEEASAREARLRQAIIDNAVEGICVCEEIAEPPHVRFTLWNGRMEEITGYSLDEINARGWFETVYGSEEDRERAVERRERLRRGEVIDPEVRTIRRQDGRERSVYVSMRVLLDTQGPPKVLAVLHDVTERQRLEAQLAEARKLEAIGRLASAVAHDFNNLLAGILGAGSILSESRSLSLNERQLTADIVAAAERGAALTRQLLTFGRRRRTELRTFDWSSQVHDVLRVVHRLMSHTVVVETRIQPGCYVRADPSMLDRVVMNLAVNARDAMPRGGTLTLELSVVPGSELDRREKVALRVEDTGEGISADSMPRIFEPFFTTKPEGRGTGLGLATVHSIVTQHEGTIRVESRVGSGTVFVVELPRAAPAQTSTVVEPSPAGAALTVLLVEDDAIVREVTRHMLEFVGHNVLEARNAEEAFQLLEAMPAITVLLTDYALGPGLSGLELWARARALRPELRGIVMSGHDGVRESPPEGCQFLQKPFGQRELARLVAGLSAT